MKKQENDLKEELQNKVTKIKENLEIYWSLLNNEIKINEKIHKGIQKFGNEENNYLKNLSKINKNEKQLQIMNLEYALFMRVKKGNEQKIKK